MSGSRYLYLLVGLAVFLAGCAASREDEAPFDHLVLVTIDTLRADHLGVYGFPRPVSPFLDTIAARGVRFANVISSSSHTGPSHASILTSQYPARHRVLRNGIKLRPAVPNLAAMLRDNGFDTAALVSVGFLTAVAQGFETVQGRRGSGYKRADVMVDTALDWFDDRAEDGRFFLWVHFFDVHNSRAEASMPEPFFARLRAGSERWSAEEEAALEERTGISPEMVEEFGDRHDRYASQIAFVDDQLGRLFDGLETRVGDDRILWVFTADHGEGLGDHGYWGHSKHLYREQVSVPLILFGGEGWHAGRVVERMVRHVDLLPTMTDLLGVSVDLQAREIEGVSLRPLLEGSEANPGIDFAVAQRRPSDKERWAKGWESGLVLSAQNERYKYILKSHGDDELYDLESDPLETVNLHGTGLEVEKKLAGWLTGKYEWMRTHPLVGTPADPKIEEEFIDELKALGYLN